MTIRLSTRVKNARLDAIEATIGTSPTLLIYSGTKPTNLTDSPTGTLLSTVALPSDWMAAASSGTKAKAGTWQDLTADAGTATAAGWFKIVDNGGTNNDMDGTCSLTGAGGDMTFDGTFTAGQAVTVTGFTLTDGN